MSNPSRSLTGPRLGLAALLLVSLALRWILVYRGGQGFWGDENRYSAAVAAWSEWSLGHGLAGLGLIIGSADHLGFKALMLIPAWLQIHLAAGDHFPAAFISLFSVANIFWIWVIARRMGADEREAFWAAAAMASSNSMFYWARHYMPYDVSLFWVLACAAVALRTEARLRDSYWAGVLGFLAFVTYNGYWSAVGCVLLAHVALAWPNRRIVLARAGLGLIGLAGSSLLLIVIARLLGFYLIPSYLDFAASINQGNYDEGYLVFFDYLWRTEGGTALIWGASLLAFGGLVRSCPAEARRRGAVWAAIVVALALVLIVGSNGLKIFVVYGRLVRQVAPFCALLVGWTAARLFGPREPGLRRSETTRMDGRDAPWSRWANAAILIIFAAGAWSMATPLRQEFPIGFAKRAAAVMTAYRRVHAGTDAAAVAPEKFRFVYDGFIWPVPNEKPLPPHYLVLLSSPHPLAWRPYLYEGFNRAQRDQIESTDITMRLVLLQD